MDKNDNNTTDEQHQLFHILFLQNVAGARNVSDKTRLEALFNDCSSIVRGEEPTETKKVVEATRLPDRC
jgi:hypothetical protein|tara:strand:- start:58 stop:264 length:207 start_codon:yes stop_codon:yes gene_type:complete